MSLKLEKKWCDYNDENIIIGYNAQFLLDILKKQVGENVIIKVPPCTQIFNEDKSVLLADLVEKNDQIIIARGGKGETIWQMAI